MKKHLIAGVVILFPVVVTLWLLNLFASILTKPFLGLIQPLLQQWTTLPQPVIVLISEILILIFLTAIILLFGIVAHWFFLHYLFKWSDALLHKIPVVKSIYKAAKDVVHSLFSPSSPTFSKVVLVPFPNNTTLSIGLVAKDEVEIIEKAKSSDNVSIFVPGTPNPMMGFLLMFKKNQLIFTDLKVDQALKFVISCAVMLPDFKIENDRKDQ